MIPKVIHYCWFGNNKLPPLAKKCISSWKKYCPDFQIKEWNEDNFDILSAPEYVKEAYKVKKWAFVTDYVRLWILYNEGGVYFDTDVELIKSIDALLDYNAFFGFEDYRLNDKVFVATGLGVGSVKKNEIIGAMMNDYENIHFIIDNGEYDLTPCPQRNSRVLEEKGFVLSGALQVNNGVVLLPSDYLCPINWQTNVLNITENTISIHHFAASWKEGKKSRRFKLLVRKIIGGKLYDRIRKIIRRV